MYLHFSIFEISFWHEGQAKIKSQNAVIVFSKHFSEIYIFVTCN
jgi:hypothetical protein